MAFKKGTRRIIARNPQTGRIEKVDLRKKQIRTIQEYNPKRKKNKWKTLDETKAKPIKRVDYLIRFESKKSESLPPELIRKFVYEFDKSKDTFLQESLLNSGFFDQIFSDLNRTKSPIVNILMSLRDITLTNGKIYPDMKLNLEYHLNKDQLKSLLDGDIKEFNRVVKSVIGSIRNEFKKAGVLFSDKRHRNFNPETKKKIRGNKKYGTIKNFKLNVKSNYWKF